MSLARSSRRALPEIPEDQPVRFAVVSDSCPVGTFAFQSLAFPGANGSITSRKLSFEVRYRFNIEFTDSSNRSEELGMLSIRSVKAVTSTVLSVCVPVSPSSGFRH